MITVLVVDDEAMTREILRDYLEADPTIEVVGEAADGETAVRQAQALGPDIILMDMQMPGMDGVAATEAIHRAHPEVCILGMSTFTSDRYVVDLLRAGASGYLVKDTRPRDLRAAIAAAVAGESVLSPAVTRHVVAGLQESMRAVQPDPALLEALTDKELQVIQLLAEGMSNREMSDVLFIAESTVKARLVRIMTKLEVRDRVQILVSAMRHGLIDLTEPQGRHAPQR
ncbi:response regulator [Serinibacter salmoneus]|uniref:LuxR family two component transcriptional regulator n=1 Tax=Serinibacter salmoneus TaxID=556530 RepID=A0A2A9CVW0_9MICO|nr:response regulator transcription factor [Serinibacter salmoneus]PFG18554.1 LuxR family two component transcriptional regulator [Serinibacter salmoneus]